MTSDAQINTVRANTNAAPTNTAAAPYRSEIGAQWDKFTAAEIANLKDKDDLVAQVQAKYGLGKAQAQKDVDAFAKGRQL
jgi:hypothetical protein